MLSTRVLWVDMLCFSSLLGVIIKSRKVDQIFFLNTSYLFSPFIPGISFLLKKPVTQVRDVVESTERIKDKSLYELIQHRLSVFIRDYTNNYASNFLEGDFHINNFNIHKFDKHIEELLYFHLYKVVEIKTLSEFINASGHNQFLLRKSVFTDINNVIIKLDSTAFYRLFSFNGWFVRNREDYYHDSYTNNYYYASKFYFVIKFFVIWLFTCILSLFLKSRHSEKKSIGIEFVQSRVKFDDINDTYWLEYEGINSEDVVGISFVNYDSNSIANLEKRGIKCFTPSDLILKKASSFSGCSIVGAKKDYFSKTVKSALGIIPFLLKNGNDSWLEVQRRIFFSRVLYWQNIYQGLGISLLWSMLDVDPEKNIKSQAIEALDGKFIGSHWSNFPNYRIDNQKCYDVFFAWSNHFANHNVIGSNLFISGYPSDHYFEKIRLLAERDKKIYSNNFVISFHDNIVFNDIMYSMQMQIDIHLMLISLLKKYYNVTILLKPKRIHTFEEVSKKVPDLKKWIENGRIKVFLGDSNLSKVPPAQVGMMSDLVVGLGISTAAAECCFSGVVSFHADLTGFYHNEFANKCDGKFLYRNISGLRLAIENQINGTGFSVEECQEYHKILDPFQDGMSYRRTGKKIKELLESLTN